ncbi:transketolase [Anaerosacchariphilus polymeriproducens]|uniref:Transketolase n=1 Tax=Anaerosacchariphilus polymeriproducens TaxID=1812858 RepID=A0A371AXG5_9FIRM|nr:transketolase [Anaerosacchariphilus polymeriproducens]RDU24268.1 transketolase [Anaerosacchariphilus polymeriproducens]
MNQNIDTKALNAIRVLAADAIEEAKSGHPGMPLGSAAAAYEMWAHHMKHNPKNPLWVNRDRFILSAGHGSILLYSLLHLFGYGLTVEDLKKFRQKGSLTPGHPEYGHTMGVEATTGPLGAGMGMAVGMAIAEAHLASVFNKTDYPVFDHYTYVLGGDGCMMEGISSEAFSLAGTLGLHKLIVLYDSNNISIEGSTEIAFTEDVLMRMKAYGFQVISVEDGNDIEEIGQAIAKAKQDKTKPSFIKINTQIGYGCPQKQGKASAHGEPLGTENVTALKNNLGWDSLEPFYIPDEVYKHYQLLTVKGREQEADWNQLFVEYCSRYPNMKEKWHKYHDKDIEKELLENELFSNFDIRPESTRNLSGSIINRIKNLLPGFIGGSADLAPSNKTYMEMAGDFSKLNYKGRNLHFGVRELSMAAIGNGIALHGGLRPFVSTFFVFSDYLKPMARLSAMMKLPITYVFTHDSIGVGEDGPTHQPVEQLAMLRAIPNLNVFRPADAKETAAAWYQSIISKTTPSAIVLTRQKLQQLEETGKEAINGAYVLQDSIKEIPDAILIASGSEVAIAVEAKKDLVSKGVDVRVVSMPCMEIFEQQDLEYRESVIPQSVRKRVVIEALSDFGWGRYVGLDGAYVTMKGFGACASGEELFEKYKITVDNVVKTVIELF